MINLKMKKIMVAAASTIFLVAVFMPVTSITSYATAKNPAANVGSTSTVTTRSEEKGYRYKFENGKLYRRLFNYYTQEWEGEWELCP